MQNPKTSFWTVTFSTYWSVFLEFFHTVTSDTTLKKKSCRPVFINMKLVFLLAAYASGYLSVRVYVMFMITNLIELRVEKLILNHLNGNNCSEFRNGLLDNQNPAIRTTSLLFCVGQFFVFCRLINKNVLERFLLKICKEHTQSRSTNLSRNHHALCFWFRREDLQMHNAYDLYGCPVKGFWTVAFSTYGSVF